MSILTDAFLAGLNSKVINPAFEIARTNTVGVLRTVAYAPLRRPEEGAKLSWLLQSVGAGGSTVSGAVDDVATTVTVADGTAFRVGMLTSVKNSDEVLLVTAVNGNDLTVTRGFGGTVAEAIDDLSVITIDSVGREENSLGTDDGIVEPELVYNFFQTIDSQLTFSRRALALAQEGNYNDMNVQLNERVEQLTIQLNRSVIRGTRATATIAGKSITYSGGLTWFLNQAGAYTVDNGAEALTETKLDDLSEQIVLRGGTTNTIAVNTRLGRVIAGLVKSNYSSQRLNEYKDDKGALTEIASDLPLMGTINRIIIDTNLNDDELIMYDSSKLSLVPMSNGNGKDSGNWRTINATQNGQDGESLRIIGDFGLEFKSFKTHAARLRNIG